MALKEELSQLIKNLIQDLRQLYLKIKQYPLISLFFVLAVVLLTIVPHWQVSGINNSTVQATQENQDRTTLAQIFGGVAIGIGLYYTWRRITIAEEDLKATQESLKITQQNLKVSQEGQFTERFTRAIEQLGNEKMEIRLGGIYALERIANESDKDYWPIVEILTAYVVKNSPADKQKDITTSLKTDPTSNEIVAIECSRSEFSEEGQISLDIQAILTVIGRRKHSFKSGEVNRINLHKTNLKAGHFSGANLSGADLSWTELSMAFLNGANLSEANLSCANLMFTGLQEANLSGANLSTANLSPSFLDGANLSGTDLSGANLSCADLSNANLSGANLSCADLYRALLPKANLLGAQLSSADLRNADLRNADLSKAYFSGLRSLGVGSELPKANLTGADLSGTNLEGAKNLSPEQLSKVKTLFNTKLDDELLIPLKEKYPALFEEPK